MTACLPTLRQPPCCSDFVKAKIEQQFDTEEFLEGAADAFAVGARLPLLPLLVLPLLPLLVLPLLRFQL